MSLSGLTLLHLCCSSSLRASIPHRMMQTLLSASLVHLITLMKSSLLTAVADVVANTFQFCCPEVFACEANQKSSKTSQEDDGYLQAQDTSGKILNLDEILDHSPPVLSAFHGFYCLAGVKAGI